MLAGFLMNNGMKNLICFLLVIGVFGSGAKAQQLVLKKGVVVNSLEIEDSVARQLMYYLPQDFELSRRWPLLFICETDSLAFRVMRSLKNVADNNGYVLAASNSIKDTTSLTQRVLQINESLQKIIEILPVDMSRIYCLGYKQGGELAFMLPSLIRPIMGVMQVSSSISYYGVINKKYPFHFVSISGKGDFQHLDKIGDEAFLESTKISNFYLAHNGDKQWPGEEYINRGVQILSLMAMKGGQAYRDTVFIQRSYAEFREYINQLEQAGEWLLAMDQLEEGKSLFKDLLNIDWLKARKKEIRKNSLYKTQKKEWENTVMKEVATRGEYEMYLEEDVLNFNLSNLGWWNNQMSRINGLQNSLKKEERFMGLRLEGYLNALVDDYIKLAAMGSKPDEDALILLYMLKTITAPEESSNYLRVISLTAKYDDFGTANFYLEELLKKGYGDADRLYNLPHTALLRITPEFNQLIDNYLKKARYAIEE